MSEVVPERRRHLFGTPDPSCGDWTITDPGSNARAASTVSGGEQFGNTSVSCGSTAPLLCLQIGQVARVASSCSITPST